MAVRLDPDAARRADNPARAGEPAAGEGAGSPPRRPKKRGLFQLAAVILRAMADRLV